MIARYIDIHLLQAVPFANLNRDDLGSPKSVQFGGMERTRVSSQSWKRAVRKALEEASGEVTYRTRRMPLEVAARLGSRGWPTELATFAGEQLAASITSKGLGLEKNGGTSVLLYLPAPVLDELADICDEHREALTAAHASPKAKKGDKAKDSFRDRVNSAIAGRNGIINLFGRMLADVPSSHVDGAVQVAHAFTVHGTSPEVDFFTAVDDLNEAAEETGSGHMNIGEFSAGTFYRYASVNLQDLVGNLRGDTELAAELATSFLTAFIMAMPNAKKNSTAPFTIPDLVYVVVRGDRPISLANAFEAPVRAPLDGGYGSRAKERIDGYAEQVNQLIGVDGRLHHAHAATGAEKLEHLGEKVTSYQALVKDAVEQAMRR